MLAQVETTTDTGSETKTMRTRRNGDPANPTTLKINFESVQTNNAPLEHLKSN